MKKVLFLLAIIFIATDLFAQRQVHNSTLNRTDFYDVNGMHIGYVINNKYMNRIEHYDSRGRLIKTEVQNTSTNTSVSSDGTYSVGIGTPSTSDENKLKWNNVYERYDVLDLYGNLVGMYRYNTYTKKWDFIKF